MLGDVSTHELLALKRISFADHTTARLTFPVANGAGKEMTGVTLFFVSDSYLGLDQQYSVPVVGKQQGNVQRHGQNSQQQNSQKRQAQGSLQQGPASDAETAGPASNRQDASDDAAEISSAVGHMNLGNANSDRVGPGRDSVNDVAGQELKQQRPNARRRG